MPHAPDTVPGKRVTGAGARTEGREASRQTSEVGTRSSDAGASYPIFVHRLAPLLHLTCSPTFIHGEPESLSD